MPLLHLIWSLRPHTRRKKKEKSDRGPSGRGVADAPFWTCMARRRHLRCLCLRRPSGGDIFRRESRRVFLPREVVFLTSPPYIMGAYSRGRRWREGKALVSDDRGFFSPPTEASGGPVGAEKSVSVRVASLTPERPQGQGMSRSPAGAPATRTILDVTCP